jgi:hypothetical protein
MPRGGPRPNSGRPVGVKSGQGKSTAITPTARRQVTDALVEKVKDINLSPLEVMLVGMKTHYDDAKQAMAQIEDVTAPDAIEDLKRLAKAELAASMTYAKEVAPYIHSKQQAVTLKGDKENPLEIALGLSSADALRKLVRGE